MSGVQSAAAGSRDRGRGRSQRGRSVVALLAAGTVGSGLVVLGAQPADAASCGGRWVNVSSGSGHGTKSGGTPIRTGPYESCGTVRVVGSGTLLAYDCWAFNSYNHLWTHLRISGTNTGGWVYNPNLDDGGSRASSSSCKLPGPH